jgi:hypothetical protein
MSKIGARFEQVSGKRPSAKALAGVALDPMPLEAAHRLP